jgi:glycosyltransferase involved in cell wall biosynthesis
MAVKPRILIYAPSVSGGLAEYVFCQAAALQKAGAEVTCLVAPSFLNGRPAEFEKVVCLGDPPVENGSRLLKKLKMAWLIFASQWTLAWQVLRRRPNLVLLDSYLEYFAPFWVWPHWLLARLAGVKYAANLHDPVRSFVVGPHWWHNLSVRLACLPLDFVLVHDRPPQPTPVTARVPMVTVPHGLYETGAKVEDAGAIREQWGVKPGQKVFLAFGFVRDGKNLDLAIRALAAVPEAFLVIAGSVASANDRSYLFYRELAAKIGVADRCRFFEGFVSDAELGRYFSGADYVLLTYSADFHSQSGVLNLAAFARRPVLASSAPGPLIDSVKRFNLGITVEPDSEKAVLEGMKTMLSSPPVPRWQEYEDAASWRVNVHEILKAAGLESTGKPNPKAS